MVCMHSTYYTRPEQDLSWNYHGTLHCKKCDLSPSDVWVNKQTHHISQCFRRFLGLTNRLLRMYRQKNSTRVTIRPYCTRPEQDLTWNYHVTLHYKKYDLTRIWGSINTPYFTIFQKIFGSLLDYSECVDNKNR